MGIRIGAPLLAGGISGGVGGAAGICTGGLGGSRAAKPLPSALRGLSCGLFMRQDFLGKLNVALGSLGARIVKQDWFAVARRFGETDASGDHGLKDGILEKVTEVVGHLFGEGGSVIVHREQDSLDLQVMLKAIPDLIDGVHQLGNAF
jgi:hypothetical protein